jgi:hypothetical protein
MSSLKYNRYIRHAAQELHVDQQMLRDLLNTADPDELLQRATQMVLHYHKEVGAVARIFGVNEEQLGRAVKEIRQRDAQRRQWSSKSQPKSDGDRHILENPPS